MKVALISALVSAVVAFSVSFLSPWFTHFVWKHQKRKEQQVAVAERYAALFTEIVVSGNFATLLTRSADDAKQFKTVEIEFKGLLFLIQVLFEKTGVTTRAKTLLAGESNENEEVRAELMAYLFAEALDLPFKNIPPLEK